VAKDTVEKPVLPMHVMATPEVNPPMSSRLALVAADQQSARSVHQHLHETLGQSAFLSSYECVRDHLGPKGSIVLLLMAGSPA